MAEKKGRPTATRKFRWTGSIYEENTNYDPNLAAKDQPEPKWVDAMGPNGKPPPNGESYGVLPDAMKFVPIWQEASCLEEVQKRIWWCSQKQLKEYRSTISAYLTERNFEKLKVLRSRKHLFGSTGSQADRNMKKLIESGAIRYVPAAERNA
mgnify:CR=1 FL=1|jgi:hypothetical protein|tara:strand:+ start:209 stop:664 length:456 start_codon:yes stop_codon:yes gene_type:complete